MWSEKKQWLLIWGSGLDKGKPIRERGALGFEPRFLHLSFEDNTSYILRLLRGLKRRVTKHLQGDRHMNGSPNPWNPCSFSYPLLPSFPSHKGRDIWRLFRSRGHFSLGRPVWVSECFPPASSGWGSSCCPSPWEARWSGPTVTFMRTLAA